MRKIMPFRMNQLSLTLDDYWPYVESVVRKALLSSRLQGPYEIVLITHAVSTESVYFYIYDYEGCRFMTLRISTHQSKYLTNSSFIRTQDYKTEQEFMDSIVSFVLANHSYLKLTKTKILKFIANYEIWVSETRYIYHDHSGHMLYYRVGSEWRILRQDDYARFIRECLQFGWILPIKQKPGSDFNKPRRLISLRGFEDVVSFMKTLDLK